LSKELLKLIQIDLGSIRKQTLWHMVSLLIFIRPIWIKRIQLKWNYLITNLEFFVIKKHFIGNSLVNDMFVL
jgi:hypothetical protein